MGANENGVAAANFGAGGFLLRWLFAAVLVIGTYNPSGYSYSHWLREAIAGGSAGPVHALVGVVLVIGWIIFVRTTWASLGMLGIVLSAVFFAAFFWMLTYYQVVNVSSLSAVVWIALIFISLLLALGMSWGHLQRRASGQVEVEKIEG